MNVIPKFQQGGGFESLFTIYKPVQTESPRRATTTTSRSSGSNDSDNSSDKGKLTEKDLFQMLKDLDGLPNEMQALVSSLTNTLRIASVTGSGDLNSLATTYLQSLYQLKRASFNKDMFKETYDRAVSNGSLNEIAITLNGNVLAMDKDHKIVSFTTQEWVQAKNSGEYQPLTNSNLLWLRYNSPEYVNNNQMLQIVENGIGLEQVHKMIKDRFHTLEKTESSADSFIPKEAAKGQQILEQMLQLGPDGYYKISTDLTETDQRQVDATLAYIYNTLPANARTRLALETNDGSQESAKAVIAAMIFGTLDTKVKHSAQYLGTESSLKGKGKDGKDGAGDIKLNTAMKWIAGYGSKEDFVINPGGTTSFMVHANTMPLVKMNGDYLGVNATLQQVAEGQFSPILDWRNVSMGGKLIDPSSLGQIVSTDGRISSIDFPCIEQNGVVMPDLSTNTREKKRKADAAIAQQGISLTDREQIKRNYQLINQIYEENGLPPAYDENGDLIPQRWRRFGVINGKASNKALGMGQFDSNPLLQEDTNDNSVRNYIEIVKDEDWDDNNFLWNGVDHLYKGTVWIPVQVNYHSAAASMNMAADVALDLDARDPALDMQNQYIKPPQLP